ncbi:TonB-dependent siderophore receptor [Methylosinus sp. PW1]|uniref:TonB-dependent siderophore receptor n=1 Tax=Methylosinus sp. PW1 TaxID=107636 RepID=UPI00055F1E21|nr:TonB-dependent siderophore receptor [Methylosinus sp. PW1]
MSCAIFSRGLSAGAATLVLIAVAHAQEALPTIDIAGDGRRQADNRNGDGPFGPGGRRTGYAAASAKSTLKTDTPLLQTPLSVQVVTRETMDDRQAIDIKDSLTTSVSGVSLGYQFYDNFKIRGFDAGGAFYRNGLRQAQSSNIETVNLQSIEVLKGPAAMLYGRVQPGGIVNLAPKRPQPIPYYSFQQQGGNFGTARSSLDVTGPLTADKTLLYRANFSYFRTDTFRDFGNRETYMFAPTISWRPTERFTLNVDGEYNATYWVDDLGDLGLPAVGRRPANIPITRYLEEPSITTKFRNANERALFAYDWTFEFLDDWSVTNRFSYQNTDYRQRIPYGWDFDENTGQLSRALWIMGGLNGGYFHRQNLSTNVDIKGKVVTGPFTHRILAGFDYYSFTSPSAGSDFFEISSINIYAPLYSPLNLVPFYAATNNWTGLRKDKWKGLYLQDQVSFWDDRIHILLGGRHDWAEGGTRSAYDEAFALTELQRVVSYNSPNSPMAGVLIQPLPWLSIYGNYTRSYGSSNVDGRTNTPLPPEIGVQYEGGVKAELLDKRLVATFAYFDIIKKNIARPVPGRQFTRLAGEAESRGVELDINGRIDDNWSIIANYSHIDVRFTKDDEGLIGRTTTVGNDVYSNYLVGKRLAAVPRNQANLWVKYDADGDLAGLSVAGGVSYVDQRPGDDINTFVLPAYARIDGMASYKFKPSWLMANAPNMTFQVNVRNLAGTTYYESSNDRFSIAPGAPRSFLASLRAEF